MLLLSIMFDPLIRRVDVPRLVVLLELSSLALLAIFKDPLDLLAVIQRLLKHGGVRSQLRQSLLIGVRLLIHQVVFI